MKITVAKEHNDVARKRVREDNTDTDKQCSQDKKLSVSHYVP
jgi:hypothetical protein